jgi:hypothetical protein
VGILIETLKNGGIMDRYIECMIDDEYETVWKYGLGVQNSEMSRINTELGIGEYHLIRYIDDDVDIKYEYLSENHAYEDIDGDILILHRNDFKKLEMQIQSLKKSDVTDEHE